MEGRSKKRHLKGGVFFYEKEDGTISDVGLHDDLLSEEVRLREELIAAGVIKEIILKKKQTNKTKY